MMTSRSRATTNIGSTYRSATGFDSEVEEKTSKVHAQKIRKVREAMFLNEMEKLADNMCYQFVSSSQKGVAPPVVPLHEIQHKIASVQEKIQTTLLQSSNADRTGSRGGAVISASSSRAGGGGGGGLPPALDPATAELVMELQKASVVATPPTGGGRHRGGDTFNELGWTATSTIGVSSRLRGTNASSILPQLPALMKTPRGGMAGGGGCGIEEDFFPMKINHFDTNVDNLASLDVAMDGNTGALSARKRKPDLVADSIRSKTLELELSARRKAMGDTASPMSSLTPWEVRILHRDKANQLGSTTRSARTTPLCQPHHPPPTAKKGQPWSARDATLKLAKEGKRFTALTAATGLGSGSKVEQQHVVPPLDLSILTARIPIPSAPTLS